MARKPTLGITPALQSKLSAKLATSALTDADGKALGLQLFTETAVKALSLPFNVEGFKIPYYDVNGDALSFYRYRYLDDTRKGFDLLTGKKAMRYAQPKGTDPELYFPPLIDWAKLAPNVDIPLLITEGELKAACATKHGYPTIGLGGVWSFQSTKNTQPLLPAFSDFELNGRAIYIVFDSDVVNNPDVVAAEIRLSRRLTERGAVVFICRLPEHEDVKKLGLDDYILLYGVDRFREEVLDGAFPYAESAVLHELNGKITYVKDPGFIYDYDMNMRMSPGAFKDHAYSNVHFWESRATKNGETMVKMPAAKAWLEWPHRGECRGLLYSPGQPRLTEDGLLNTWVGWGPSEPEPGNVEPWHDLMRHLFDTDAGALKWFTQWCAYPLQNPGVKLATAAALWGSTHGSGKTLVGHTLMRIYGKNSVELKDADLESTRFEWAENKQFALADDISSRGDRKMMRRLMVMITQKYLHLDPKYIPSYFIVDLINYLFTSNEPDALFMDDQDRRFFVHEVRAGKFLPFREYVKWRDSEEGICALWDYLLNIDLSDFEPQAPAPDTIGKSSMIEVGKSDLGAFVYELRANSEQLLSRANLKGDLFTSQELHLLYDPAGTKRASANALARELKRAGINPPANGSKIRLADGSMRMVYAVRNGDAWNKSTWKAACDHYDKNHPARKQGVKF